MPSHFVAFQVNDPTILKNLALVQKQIEASHPELAPSILSIKKCHVPLFVVDLPHIIEKQAVVEFKKFAAKFKSEFHAKPIKLEIKGADHLTTATTHNLLFANVNPNHGMPQIKELADELKERFRELGAKVDVGRSLFLHMTIANTALSGQEPVPIPLELVNQFKSVHFGVQKVFSVQLLSAKKSLDVQGYYYCEEEVMF